MRCIVKFRTAIFILIISASGCASLQSEFYRGETRYLYRRGCQHYKQGDYQAARRVFEDVISLDPGYGPAHGALGNIAFVEGAHEACIVHFQNAIQADPGLESSLRPLVLTATMQAARKPIIDAGVDLRRIYKFVKADERAALEAILSKDFPLELLARDTLSLTPPELNELGRKVAAYADPESGTVRYRLFAAYCLFHLRRNPELSAALIEQAVQEATLEERKTAYVILGQLRERLGDYNRAVDAYLMALKSGVPGDAVAPRLARIYKTDSRLFLQPGKPRKPATTPVPSCQIELSLTGPVPACRQADIEGISPVDTPNLSEKGFQGDFLNNR